MSKYKVGDMVRVVLEPSEKNKDHFLTNYYTDIPLEYGGVYEITDVGVYLEQPYFRLKCWGKSGRYGTPRSWNVLPSAVAPLYTVEEELD